VRVAFLTDTEGRWSKLAEFADRNPMVRLDGDRIDVDAGAVFVFGGDAIDRGPDGQRLIAALSDAKRRDPERVVLLAGNRDLNKLRLIGEVAPAPADRRPHPRAPEAVARGPRSNLVRWTLAETMNAGAAFEHRRAELAAAGAPCGDDAVADSFVAEVLPGGALLAYLGMCQLGWRAGDVLVVHGAVSAANWGRVPGDDRAGDDLDGWIARLNAFCARSVAAAAAGDVDGFADLVRYQAPWPGLKVNPHSVVYGRPTDAWGNAMIPDVADRLADAGVAWLLLGHTPSGDAPVIVAAPRLTTVFADTSYSRLEAGSQVLVDGDVLRVRARARLDHGAEVAVEFAFDPRDPGPIGRRYPATRALAIAPCGDGSFLTWLALAGYAHAQRVEAAPAAGTAVLADFAVAPGPPEPVT